jgi:hypothetical protein
MPEYYIEIKHKRNETVKEAVIEHCNIAYFLKTLMKAGWRILSCIKMAELVEEEPTGTAMPAVEAAQSVR